MATSQPSREPAPVNEIFQAISHGKSREELEQLVKAGVPWKDVFSDGYSVLQFAAMEGHLEAVDYFVSMGADLNSQDKQGFTPLFSAAIYADKNFIQIVDILVANGSDLMALDVEGDNLLMAATSGHQSTEDLEILISRGLRYDTKNNYGMSILNHAELSGNMEAIRFFIGKGLNYVPSDYLLNNPGKMTVFQSAIWYRQSVQNLQWIIDLGVKWDKTDTDDDGDTWLHFSVISQHPEAVKFFVSKGVDIEKKNKRGETALEMAYRIYSKENPALYEEIMKVIIEGFDQQQGENLKEKVQVLAYEEPSSNLRREQGAGPSQENFNDSLCSGFASLNLEENRQPFKFKSLGKAKWTARFVKSLEEDMKKRSIEGGNNEEISKTSFMDSP